MVPQDLQFWKEAVQGEWVGSAPDRVATRVGTDSRTTRPGELFVALGGDRFDGHEFLSKAKERGAIAAVIQRDRQASLPPGMVGILVDDPRIALGRMAAAYRRLFRIPVIAVAGSNGKTTTKELLAGVLSSLGPIRASEASFNNDVGVPATLLGLDAIHRAAVVEVGTNHPGELKPLLAMCRPTVGVLTSIGREHLEHFGTLEGVVAEEGELAAALPSDGVLFVNSDSPGADEVAARSAAPFETIGTGAGCQWRIAGSRMTTGGMAFHLEAREKVWSGEWNLKLRGEVMCANAVLALAVAARLGVEPAAARVSLSQVSPAKGRLQEKSAAGVVILDDTYNANPDSVRAGLAVLREFPVPGRRWAVLGDLAEQGIHAQAGHEEMGRAAAESLVDGLVAVGRHASWIAGSARRAGLTNVWEVDDAPDAIALLGPRVAPGDVVWVKASRSARLERVVDGLIQLKTGAGAGKEAA